MESALMLKDYPACSCRSVVESRAVPWGGEGCESGQLPPAPCFGGPANSAVQALWKAPLACAEDTTTPRATGFAVWLLATHPSPALRSSSLPPPPLHSMFQPLTTSLSPHTGPHTGWYIPGLAHPWGGSVQVPKFQSRKKRTYMLIFK